MSMKFSRRGMMAWIAIVMMVAGGCAPTQPKAPEPPQKKTSMEMDPCAEQLHEIAGLMLEYYVGRHELPGNLAELKALAPNRPALFKCPTSGQPYIYDPKGIAPPVRAGDVGRVVLYDASPVHYGMRWGIAVGTPRPGLPLVTRVIAIPSGTAEKAPWR